MQRLGLRLVDGCEAIDKIFHRLNYVELVRFKRKLAHVHARYIEKVLDQYVQAATVVIDNVELPQVLFG